MKYKLSRLQIIALGYFLIIFTGALLLMTPAASNNGVTFTQALFTATSASCVTGLVVVDTGTTWTLFGQIVILVMIQVGGLGFMTVATIFYRLLRRKIGLREREVIVDGLNASHVGGILGMTRLILKGTAVIEGIGALLLSFRFIPMLGFLKGVWYSVFHSVSAFCNAGFDIMGPISGEYSSLMYFADDPLVNLVVMALIIVGGIGFFVWDDLRKKRFRFRRYSLHTKLLVVSSGILVFGGAAVFFITERYSGHTGRRVLEALFDSVTARTAGFNTTDTAQLSSGGKLLTIILMLIGGSPGSTAGGIKTTTVAVLILYVFSQIRHLRSTSVFSRRIPDGTLEKATAVFFINLSLALLGALFICAVQDMSLTDVLFETSSAIGTVGMSTGITRDLVQASRYMIIFLMFCGRVGSISFALALFEKRARPAVQYPPEEVTIG